MATDSAVRQEFVALQERWNALRADVSARVKARPHPNTTDEDKCVYREMNVVYARLTRLSRVNGWKIRKLRLKGKKSGAKRRARARKAAGSLATLAAPTGGDADASPLQRSADDGESLGSTTPEDELFIDEEPEGAAEARVSNAERKRRVQARDPDERERARKIGVAAKQRHITSAAKDRLEAELEYFGGNIREWRERIIDELNYDPLGFYVAQLSGQFKVMQGGLSEDVGYGEIPFLPTAPQRAFCREIIWHRWAATDEGGWQRYQQEFRGKPRPAGRFMRLVVKNRRAKFSTNMAHIANGDGTMNQGANAIITAHDDKGLISMEQMLRTLMGDKKQSGAQRFSSRLFQTMNGSLIRLNNPQATLGIGFDYNTLHWTEVDYIPDIDAALKSVTPSMRKGPMAIMVLESQMRADAVSGFKDYVDRSIKGETAYQVWFQGWMQNDDAVLEPSPEERLAIHERRSLQGADGYEFKTLMDEHHATVEQVAWWRRRFKEDADYKLRVMWEMYPTTLAEAVSVQDSVAWLRPSAVEFLRGLIREPDARYLLKYDGISQVDQYQALTEPVLNVWEPPRPNHEYLVGMDPANILSVRDPGSDTYFVVLDKNEGRVVADWYGKVLLQDGTIAAWQAAKMYNEAMIIPEVMADGSGPADYLVNTLGYWNVFERLEYGRVVTTLSGVYGFKTTHMSRSVILSRLQASLNNHRIALYSKRLLNDLMNLAKHGAVPGKSAGVSGTKRAKDPDSGDDGAMALALCLAGERYFDTWVDKRIVPDADTNHPAPVEQRKMGWVGMLIQEAAERTRAKFARQYMDG